MHSRLIGPTGAATARPSASPSANGSAGMTLKVVVADLLRLAGGTTLGSPAAEPTRLRVALEHAAYRMAASRSSVTWSPT